MTWIQSSGGVVGTNLDLVRSWVANSNGSVTLTFSDSTSGDRTIPGVGSDEASAAEAMRRLTDTVNPADY